MKLYTDEAILLLKSVFLFGDCFASCLRSQWRNTQTYPLPPVHLPGTVEIN